MSKQKITDKTIIAELRKLVQGVGSQRAFAGEMHCSAQFLSDVLKGQRAIPAAWAEMVGYRKEWVRV